MASTKRIVIGALAALAGLGLYLLRNNQEKIIYLPDMPQHPRQNPVGYRNPSEQGLPYTEVEIDSDGVKLRGWLILSDRPTSSPTLIYFQENAGNIGQRLGYVKGIMAALPVNFLIVGYRGYSDSEGKPNEQGLKTDGISILNWATTCMQIDRNQIYILGRSLGGAVGCYVASNSQNRPLIKGLILENTFTSLTDVVRRNFGILSWLLVPLIRNKWESIKEIPSILCPLLFITGMQDELIVPAHTRELKEAARKHGKRYDEYEIARGTHNQMWEIEREEYVRRLAAFLQVRPKL